MIRRGFYTNRRGSRMNLASVIFWMTLAVLLVLTVLAVMLFDGWPPWPLLLSFAISHGAFCFIVSRVKPYRGPYKDPLTDPGPGDWPEL
jgi:fatty acid desaturase